MTVTTLPISSERAANSVIFPATELVAVEIRSMVLAAACITVPPWLAISADLRLALAADSAFLLISPIVAVISWAAAAIWLVLPDCDWALPLASNERVLIWAAAAERFSAPWATVPNTERIAATLVLSAVDMRPNSSLLSDSTITV